MTNQWSFHCPIKSEFLFHIVKSVKIFHCPISNEHSFYIAQSQASFYSPKSLHFVKLITSFHNAQSVTGVQNQSFSSDIQQAYRVWYYEIFQILAISENIAKLGLLFRKFRKKHFSDITHYRYKARLVTLQFSERQWDMGYL